MSDVRDPILRELLDERTAHLTPRPDALERVQAAAGRRHRRRRVAAGTSALVATTVVLIFAGGVLREPVSPDSDRAATSAGTRGIPKAIPLGAVSLRNDMGIAGPTKGAAGVVVAKSPYPGSDKTSLAVIRMDTGLAEPLPKNAASATFSPQETTVAIVTTHNRVVVESTVGRDRHVLGHQRRGANISWDPSGTALFAFVDHHWIRVPAPGATGTVQTSSRVRVLGVPRLPGGPSFLSVSPGKDSVVLFGVSPARTSTDAGAEPAPRLAGRPHLYLGGFDGRRVSRLRRLGIPATALHGPMGWLGDNAFVIGTGMGTAWIVRVDGTHLAVAVALPEGCSLAGAPTSCQTRGPRVLGTNAGGSLLYWRIRGVAAPSAHGGGSTQDGVVAYFSTWLDGSHPKQLIGPAGIYGPATAAR